MSRGYAAKGIRERIHTVRLDEAYRLIRRRHQDPPHPKFADVLIDYEIHAAQYREVSEQRQKPRCSVKACHRSTGILSLCKFTGNPAVPSGFLWMHTGALAVLNRLAIQALISLLEGTGTPVFALAEHLGERLGRTDRADDMAGAGASGLVTDQAGLEPGRLVTDQARPGQEDLSTAQADRPSGSLFTAQADGPSRSLFTAQAERPSGKLVHCTS